MISTVVGGHISGVRSIAWNEIGFFTGGEDARLCMWETDREIEEEGGKRDFLDRGVEELERVRVWVENKESVGGKMKKKKSNKSKNMF